MISKKMEKALNEQFNREYYSNYLYLAMSAYCTSINFEGAAHWMRLQSHEETEHAMKIFDYLHHQQANVTLDAVERPAAKWKSLPYAFQKALEHEKYITKSINDLYTLAVQEKDYATQAFLQWFVNEQIEEESEAQRVVDRMAMAKDCSGTLLYLDKELGKRKGE